MISFTCGIKQQQQQQTNKQQNRNRVIDTENKWFARGEENGGDERNRSEKLRVQTSGYKITESQVRNVRLAHTVNNNGMFLYGDRW